jgi:hypothetical protein
MLMIRKNGRMLRSAAVHAAGIFLIAGQAAAMESFSLSVTPLNQRVQSGTRVVLEVVITNTSDHDLVTGSMYQGGSNASYQIDVKDGAGIRLKKRERPDDNGKGLYRGVFRSPLKPNESVRDLVNVTAFYDMRNPDEYTIQLSRQLEKDGPLVKSNVVTITILPKAKP